MAPFFDVHGDPLMDPYTILSLPHTASEAEIKKAYRMQMLQLHPDKLSPTLSENSIADVTEKFHNVKDAYEFLISPTHLTGRRLYQAKMASRRAEYERREAYLRRNGGADPPFAAPQQRGGVSGYASGGGGGAGMAGSGMPNGYSNSRDHHHRRRSGHAPANSHAVPSGGDKHNRSKSEPPGPDGEGAAADRRRGRAPSGAAGKQPKAAGRGTHSGHHNPAKHKRDRAGTTRERNGYKSDSAGKYDSAKAKQPNREGRNGKPRSSGNKNSAKEKEGRRQRGKSEQPRRRSKSMGERKAMATAGRGRDRKSRESRDGGGANANNNARQKKERKRAKSAPARSSGGNGNNSNNNNNKYSSSGGENAKSRYDRSNLPREWFCPLTKRLMKDPVMDEEGNTYEREAIERWLRVQSSSPITNGYLSADMLRPDRALKREIYKATGIPRSKSQSRTKSRSTSPTNELVSGRVLIDSYLREISSKSKLSVSLDGMGICAFSYRRITFVIEVPITPHAGFMVYSSFDGEADGNKLEGKIEAWNRWLGTIGRHSRVSYLRTGQKTVFTLKGNEGDMSRCDVFQKTLEYFVEMSLKLHNLLHPKETKVVENVCLTRTPVSVT